MTSNNAEIITSTQNKKIKNVLLLQQKKTERQAQGMFVVEGARELTHSINAGYKIDSLFICTEILPHDTEISNIKCNNTYYVSPNVYNKIAYRGGTEGVIAIVASKKRTLKNLTLPENPLIVVLESVEKPGNLGAILRSADAAGVDAVIVCDPLTDMENPNLIRSSIGAAFTVQCVSCTSEECINFLKTKNIKILTAQLQDSKLYYDTNMNCGVAIVMGTEATGLTEQWRKAADAHIRIPMLGKLDSLNVSVSAAVLMYEAVRQRQDNY